MHKDRNIAKVLCGCVLFLCSLSQGIFAQERWWPGGSQYFRADIKQQLTKRDALRDTLNIAIHEKANGDHAKSLALRAYLYEYCGKRAQYILDTQGIQLKKTGPYETYIFLQTQLYQYLQATVTKARVVLDMPQLSFKNVIQQLQTQDPSILYFYTTLPRRYNDIPILDEIGTIQQALLSYKNANNIYPTELTDMVEHGFLPRSSEKILDSFVYIAHNRPFLSHVDISYTSPFIPTLSWYILAAPISHPPYATLQTRDEQHMKIMQRTLQYTDRESLLKKHTSLNSGSVLWNVVLGK